MGDIKLFAINNDNVLELKGKSVALEKSLQTLIENHLEEILGIQFIETEYSTGKKHGGRIDSLGIDENNSPVIIEYKRSTNENVINQGLYYLDWLLDHKAEFEILVMRKLNNTTTDLIDWQNPRLLCIANDFTKYDEHAVQQINRNIELYRYKYYDEGFLLFDLVNATTATTNITQPPSINNAYTSKKFSDNLSQLNQEVSDRYQKLHDYMLSLGDEVQYKELKYYGANKRIKNLACVEVIHTKHTILVHVKADLENLELEEGFSKDVSKIGHYGTGNLALYISSDEELEKAKTYIEVSYLNN